MNPDSILQNLAARTHQAVAHYWAVRAAQSAKQKQVGRADQGLRSAVTGGAQMDGFIDMFSDLVKAAGIPDQCVYRKKGVELPRRYELFCRKLVLERQYSAAAFIASSGKDGIGGRFSTPADDLAIERFARVLLSHLGAFA